MPGKLCTGSEDIGFADNSKAFCEGMAARISELSPSNPHPATSDDGVAWQKGVDYTVAETPITRAIRPAAGLPVVPQYQLLLLQLLKRLQRKRALRRLPNGS